jgi:hypothetical protein
MHGGRDQSLLNKKFIRPKFVIRVSERARVTITGKEKQPEGTIEVMTSQMTRADVRGKLSQR